MHARKALCARFQFDRAPRLLILAALALSFALCASSPLHAQNSVTFTPPANVSNDSSGFAPQVLVDLAGNIYIGYLIRARALAAPAYGSYGVPSAAVVSSLRLRRWR